MRHRSFAHTSLLLAISMAFTACLISCGQPSPSTGNEAGSVPTPAGPPLHIAVDGFRFEFNTPARMCHVPLIVVGIASTYAAAHWDTPDGTRPSYLTPAAAQTQGYMIYTPLRFRTFQILQDFRHQPTREYVLLGGQVGQDTYSLADYPRPPIGQRYLMEFVHSNRAGQAGYFQDILVLYDMFPIDSHKTVLLQQQSVEQGQVVGQNVTISLADLTAQLATCPKV